MVVAFFLSVHALQISERMTGISHIPCQSHFIVDVLNKNDPSKMYITIWRIDPMNIFFLTELKRHHLHV